MSHTSHTHTRPQDLSPRARHLLLAWKGHGRLRAARCDACGAKLREPGEPCPRCEGGDKAA